MEWSYGTLGIFNLILLSVALIVFAIYLIKKYFIWTKVKEGVSWGKAVLIITISSVFSIMLSIPIASIFHNSDRSCENDTLFGCGFADLGESFIRIILVPILFIFFIYLLFNSMKEKKK